MDSRGNPGLRQAASVPDLTVLSDHGRQFCDWPDRYYYELFLQLQEIESRSTPFRQARSNGFVERCHRTLLKEHLRI